MRRLTDVQFISDKNGVPEYAVIPFSVYKKTFHYETIKASDEATIPQEVVEKMILEKESPIQAWREYLDLTQAEVAERLGISQSAYCQMETVKKPRKATLQKIAKAMNIDYLQLDI